MKKLEPRDTRAVTGGTQTPPPREIRPEEPFVPDEKIDLDTDHAPTDPPQ